MPCLQGGLGLKVHTLPSERDIPCVASTHTPPPRTPCCGHLPHPAPSCSGPVQVHPPVWNLHASSHHKEMPFLLPSSPWSLPLPSPSSHSVCIAPLLSGLRALGLDPCLFLLWPLWHLADFLYSQCLVTAQDRRCPGHVFPGAPLSRLLLATVSGRVEGGLPATPERL